MSIVILMSSRVFAGFLAASEMHFLTVKVCGKQKREVFEVILGGGHVLLDIGSLLEGSF